MPPFNFSPVTISRTLSRARNTTHLRSQQSSVRAFHRTTRLFPQKDTQDKDSLKPSSSEYSKTGGGDDAAAHESAAFDPNQTKPEEEVGNTNQKEGADNSLNMSPGNTEASTGVDPQTGGSQGSVEEKSGQASERTNRTSGAGSAPKQGGGKSG